MFKFPTSLTDPTLQSLSLEDYFNPTKNKFFITGRRFPTFTELETFWKALFTRENMVEHWESFFPPEYMGPMEKNDIVDMLSGFTDDELWLFVFSSPGHMNSGNRTSWSLLSPRMIDYSDREMRLDFQWTRTAYTSGYSYRGANFATEHRAKLQICLQIWEGMRSQYTRYGLNAGDSLVYNNATASKMSLYFSNRKCYVNSELSPETLSLTISDVDVIRVHAAYGTCKVTLVQLVTKANKTPLYRIFPYSYDVLEILPWPLVASGEKKPLLFGVELEVATGYSPEELVTAADEPFFACKQDSSISGVGRHKVEMVTVPMSLKAHKKEWSHLFSNLDYERFDTTIETNNGMHVHIERRAFTEQHLRTFAWFFGNPTNLDFIVALSERKANQMHQYAAMPAWRPQTSKVTALRSVVDMFNDLRGAVNLHKHKPTVEVRIFKGIASYATILKNLEVVDAIFHFTQQSSQSQPDIRKFLNFLRKTPRNKYPVLKEFLLTLDMKKILSTAQLNDFLFNVSDPKQILSIVQKKNFPITSHHVSILNAKQGTRTFIFNKEKGVMEIVRTKYGKMSHLDRALEKKYTRSRPTVTPTPIPIVIPDTQPAWFEPAPPRGWTNVSDVALYPEPVAFTNTFYTTSPFPPVQESSF